MDIRSYLGGSKKRSGESASEGPPGKMLKTTSFEVLEILSVDFNSFTTMSQFEIAFDEIAEKLLNSFRVVINGRAHRFEEIEFYCYYGIHQDPFSHCNPLQQSCGKWYFHKNGQSYRGGSYKGVDLTFGEENKGFGGILIRAVEDLTAQKLVEGPSLTVDHILSLCDVPTIAEFVKMNGIDATNNGKFHIRYDDTIAKRKVFKTPRVGLTLKKADEEHAKYVMKSYRYLTLPKQTKKGKIQLVLALYRQGSKVSEIAKLTGSTEGKIQSYIKAFEAGKTKKVMDFAQQSLDNEAICSLYGAWCTEFGDSDTKTTEK